MTGDLPERDPFADLVARSVGVRVDAVTVEELAADEGIERKRLRYDTSDGPRTVVFERRRRGETIEAQLLPFLARKTDRVTRVYSRGLPPPHASLGPWVLLEDALSAPIACDGDPVDVLRAKLAIEAATRADAPALRALGLPERRGHGALASAPLGLVHGALVCANARRLARGAVILGWASAFLGPTVLDAASLISDLQRRGDADAAKRVRRVFVQESGVADAEAELAAAALKLGAID